MALTTAQRSEIRLLSGDNGNTNLVDNDLLDAWYDEGSGSLCYVIVKVIEARMADATMKQGTDLATGRSIPNPAVAGIEALLRYWRNRCADAVPRAGVSTLSLGIDEESDLIQNP